MGLYSAHMISKSIIRADGSTIHYPFTFEYDHDLIHDNITVKVDDEKEVL